MLTTTLRSMIANKLRLALTTSAIALGVAFLAGTFILTASMQSAFDSLFGKVASGTDAVVRTPSSFGDDHAPIDASVIDAVAGVDGVRAAEGHVEGYALMTDPEGKAIFAASGAQTFGFSMPKDEGLRGDVTLRQGHAPTGPNEIVVDAHSASSHHLALGSQIRVLFHGPSEQFTVVGVVTFGDEQDLGGSTVAYFDVPTAQAHLGTPGAFSEIHVSAASGVTDQALTDRIDAVLPDGTEALTGSEITQEFSDNIKSDLGFVTILFSVFAGIALFVGSFIIWNTFTMIVSQRSREIALLRAVGSTRGQVLRSLLLEAVLLGVGSSAVGIGLGVGVAKGLTKLMDQVGFSLPSGPAEVSSTTIITCMLVGTLVTVAAAMVPARRATKVLPIEALRESVPGSSAPSRRRAVIGGLLTSVGVAGMVAGLFGGMALGIFGLGVLALVVGVVVLLPVAVRPMASAIGAPLALRGLPGEMARQNAMRNPRRTAATASALMIGLTLVVGVGVVASSLKGSLGGVLSNSTNADLYLAKASMTGLGFSTEVGDKAKRVPGVETVSTVGWGEARFAGSTSAYSSIDPATADKAFKLHLVSGRLDDLGTDGLVVSQDVADQKGWTVGSAVPVEFSTTGVHQQHVTGIIKAEPGYLDGDYLISQEAQTAFDGTSRLDSGGVILLSSGADRAAVQAALRTALADNPDAKVLTQKQYEKEAGGFIDQLLVFVTVMLMLAVVIALLGIVNTLALSVFERKRELGLLRAVGMTRNQVRAMVRWESVVISLIGATAGAALGIGLGVSLARAMKDTGVGSIVVPGPQIALYVGLAAVAGVLAALGPARSAAKVDVLKAVVTD